MSQERAAVLRAKLGELRGRERTLNATIAVRVAAGIDADAELQDLRAQRAALRNSIEDTLLAMDYLKGQELALAGFYL